MSSKNSKWWKNVHGAKKHEAKGEWKGGGLLLMDLEVGSWFTSTKHI
jgi:hypothetical protein